MQTQAAAAGLREAIVEHRSAAWRLVRLVDGYTGGVVDDCLDHRTSASRLACGPLGGARCPGELPMQRQAVRLPHEACDSGSLWRPLSCTLPLELWLVGPTRSRNSRSGCGRARGRFATPLGRRQLPEVLPIPCQPRRLLER